jgi:hypothetical protein
VYAFPGPALSNYALTSLTFPGFGLWFTVLLGSADDDGHREMLAARSGSLMRVHATRAFGAGVILCVLSILCTLAPIAFGVLRYQTRTGPPLPSSAEILAGGLALHLAAGAIGIAVGTFLHRPLLRRTPVTVLFGVALTALLPVAPPVLDMLRRLDRNDPSTTSAFLAAAVVINAVAVFLASRLAARR